MAGMPLGLLLAITFDSGSRPVPPPAITVVAPFQENLVNNMLGVIDLPNFYTDPDTNRQTLTNVNKSYQGIYTVGWMPVGMNVTVRSMLGVRPYG